MKLRLLKLSNACFSANYDEQLLPKYTESQLERTVIISSIREFIKLYVSECEHRASPSRAYY